MSVPAFRERLLAAVGGDEKKFEYSFHARTFSPERVAKAALDDGADMWARGADAILSAGGNAEMAAVWGERFLRKWSAFQHSGARVMNWMITGPARFPVETNRKRMETENKRRDEMLYHVDNAAAWARKRLRSAEKVAASEAVKVSGIEHKEKVFPGGRIVLNKPLDRVQLIFDGKPDEETRSQLKSRAFRWSPREGAWQRQLTQNGVWAAEAVVKSLAVAS